jgi:uncharacterized protein
MTYVFDANAMIAYLNDEEGADVIEGILDQSDAICSAHAINVCEVFYGILRDLGIDKARESLAALYSLGLQVRSDMDEAFWQDAGGIKAAHKLSLADAFAVAFARKVEGELLTSDHHELEAIAAAGVCRIKFFR